MKLFRSWPLAVLAVLVSVVPCLAQVPAGWVQVTAAHTMDAGVLIANGTVSFAPVGNTGVATSFRVGSATGGQAGPDPWTAAVTNGAFTILVPDSVLAYPTEVCYSITITDNASGNSILGPGYTCVQPAGSGGAISGSQAWCTAGTGGAGATCNFDNFLPVLTPNVFGSGFDSAGSALAAQNAAEAFATEAVGTETSRAETAEAANAAAAAANATSITNETSRAEGAESTLTTAVTAVTATANAALPAASCTNAGNSASQVLTCPNVINAATFGASSTLNLPASAIIVQNDFITAVNLTGTTNAGDVLSLQGWVQINGNGTGAGDSHGVGVKGIADYYGSGSLPKLIGMEGALTNDGNGNCANCIGVQGFFGGNLGTGTITYSQFQADANPVNNGAITKWVDFHSPAVIWNTAPAANSYFAFLNEDPNKAMETYGPLAVGATYPQAKFHVFGCASNEAIPSSVSAGSLFENCGTSASSFIMYSLTPAGPGLEVTNAGQIGIGTAAAPAYPLEIGATGIAAWFGDAATPTLLGLSQGRAWFEYDAHGNAVIAGGLAKGVGFIPASTNGALAPYAGLFDVNDCFGVGSNPNSCLSDLFYVNAAGVVTLAAGGAASTSVLNLTGAPYVAGSATTNTPLAYINGGAAPTTWSTLGTYFGINGASGFTGNMVDLHDNGGGSVFSVAWNGATAISNGLTSSAQLNEFGGGPASAVVGIGQAVTTGTLSSATGKVFAIAAGTISRTNDTGTIAQNAVNSIAQATLTAGAATTYTNADTLYIAGAPIASTNVTITNDWSLYVAAGNSFFAGTLTASGATLSASGGASAPALSMTGSPYNAGSTTSNTPLDYLNGGSAPSTWSTLGTYFGINAASGFTGNLIDLHDNGSSSVFTVAYNGATTIANGLTSSAQVNEFGSGAPSAVAGIGQAVTTGTISSTAGKVFAIAAGTISRTADTGTIAQNAVNSIAQATLTAGAATTYTNADTLYIAGAPIASTNVTITNDWSLYVAAGESYFGGGLTVGTAVLIASNVSLTNGAAAAAGTLTNAPAAGNPTKWIPISDNGTTRYVPAW